MGFALRALNIEISGIRDNVSDVATGMMRTQFWKDAVSNIYKKKNSKKDSKPIPSHPVVLELDSCLSKHSNVSIDLLHRLVSSREIFLSDPQCPFQNIDDVNKYSEHAFSSINNILLECLMDSNCSKEIHGHARHCANQLGKAEGIVTLLRALPYNASHRRVYLPMNLLVTHKISSESIIRGKDTPEVRHVMEAVAAIAEDHLQNCRFRSKYLSTDEKLIMLPAVTVDSYLAKLHKANCNAFDNVLQRQDSWLPFNMYLHKWKGSY